MDKQRPSEIVQAFLDYLEACKNEYEVAYADVGEEDKRVQDFLHAMEFAPTRKERNKIATQLHNSRVARRIAKDKSQELEKIYKFYKDPANVPMLKKLRNLVKEQKRTEEYLESERHYKPRVGDVE